MGLADGPVGAGPMPPKLRPNLCKPWASVRVLALPSPS